MDFKNNAVIAMLRGYCKTIWDILLKRYREQDKKSRERCRHTFYYVCLFIYIDAKEDDMKRRIIFTKVYSAAIDIDVKSEEEAIDKGRMLIENERIPENMYEVIEESVNIVDLNDTSFDRNLENTFNLEAKI